MQDMLQGVYGRDPQFSAEKDPAFCNYALRDSQSVMDEFVKDPLLQLTIASYWLNRVLGGLVPSDFHMVNIAIHAMASALVTSAAEMIRFGSR